MLRRFYARRLLRLYPALTALLLLGLVFYRDVGRGGTLAGYAHTAAFAGLYVEDFAYSFSSAHGRFFGAHGGLGVTWSLAVEEQFYLLWSPLLLLALRRDWRPWLAPVLAVTAVAATIGNQALIHANVGPTGYIFTPWVNAIPLIVGCLLAVVMADHRKRPGEGVVPPIAAVGGTLGLIGIWIVDDHVGNGHVYAFQLLACAIAAAAGVFSFFVIERPFLRIKSRLSPSGPPDVTLL